MWRGKPSELPNLFGEENLQRYQTYLRKKTCRATRHIWRQNLQLPGLFGEHMQSYKPYLKRSTLRATRPIWRGNPAELPNLFGGQPRATRPICRGNYGELLDLFGEETLPSYQTYLEDNLESYQTYMERKSWRATRPIWEENLQNYQIYLERTSLRITRPIWRGKSAELPDLLGDENLESYNKLTRENSGHRLASIN